MINLRELAEKDLAETLEGEWSLPVILIGPDGIKYDKTVDGRNLTGQVLYGRREFNPDTGEEIFINTPVVTLRISSLVRVPADTECWGVKIPVKPSTTADMDDFIFNGRPSEGGATIGFMRIYPQRMVQG